MGPCLNTSVPITSQSGVGRTCKVPTTYNPPVCPWDGHTVCWDKTSSAGAITYGSRVRHVVNMSPKGEGTPPSNTPQRCSWKPTTMARIWNSPLQAQWSVAHIGGYSPQLKLHDVSPSLVHFEATRLGSPEHTSLTKSIIIFWTVPLKGRSPHVLDCRAKDYNSLIARVEGSSDYSSPLRNISTTQAHRHIQRLRQLSYMGHSWEPTALSYNGANGHYSSFGCMTTCLPGCPTAALSA